MSRGSVYYYWLDDLAMFDPRQRQNDFSSSLCVQTIPGAHPTSCPMGTGVPFPGSKERPERDADHSLPSSAEVMNGKLYLLSPLCLYGV
jgi:hypothetical protein